MAASPCLVQRASRLRLQHPARAHRPHNKQHLLPARPCRARQPNTPLRWRYTASAAPEDSVAPAPEVASQAVEDVPDVPEETLFEGSGATAELVVSLLLASTVLYIPLTLAALVRRASIKYRFTNKRISVTNTSPLFKSQVDISYNLVKEVKAVGRCFSLWGDMVILLKDGRQLELTAVDDFKAVKATVERYMTASS